MKLMMGHNVQIEGLRAFAQSRSNAGLGIGSMNFPRKILGCIPNIVDKAIFNFVVKIQIK